MPYPITQRDVPDEPQGPSAQPASKELRERALLERIARRDRQAFEELYAEYYRRLSRFLTRLTPRHDLIEEAVNDTFWVVWEKARDFRGASMVSTWIMGIAYRCTLKALRRSGGGEPTESLGEETLNQVSEEPQIDFEMREWIAAGLGRLPVEQRMTIELAYYLGHSCEEIGQIMECSAGTVRARMFHARVKLRNLLPSLGGFADGAFHESI
jgi:RNA polymerase sigma-70 factor (ECF subfamily)